MPAMTWLALWSPVAWGHIGLDEPTARYEDQKDPPCGSIADARTGNVTVFEPGATVTVSWRETIDHPSHYRISFDEDGADDFVDPPEMYAMYAAPSVLLDGIPDDPGGGFSVEVTLPDVECENCTLQVIQVMYDKPPYTIPGDDIYYQCADIALRRSASPVDTGAEPSTTAGVELDDTGDKAGGGGCGCGGGVAGGWFVAPLVALAVRRSGGGGGAGRRGRDQGAIGGGVRSGSFRWGRRAIRARPAGP